jgi:hypothetical protein
LATAKTMKQKVTKVTKETKETKETKNTRIGALLQIQYAASDSENRRSNLLGSYPSLPYLPSVQGIFILNRNRTT